MRRRLFYVLALAPGLAGMLIGLLMETGLLPTSIFVLRLQASAATFAALAGIAFIGLSLITLWLLKQWEGRAQRALAKERDAQAEAHRRFIRRLNHELKNPLTAIRTGLANLNEEYGTDGSAGGSLHNVMRQIERLGRLTNDLRKLADLEADEVEKEPIDLAEIIEEAVEMAKSAPRRGEPAVSINIQKLPWPLSSVQGDRDLLLLAIYNLLDNALKFSGTDATIEVRASEDGERATIEVIDTGCGIASDDLPHVAEELFRGQKTQGVDGSGLGLALVERIVALHGGKLAIRSREGQGTVATLSVPLWHK